MYHPSRRIGSHTIRLIPTAHILNVQSGSSRPPTFSMYNQAVPDLPCSQCTIRQFTTSHVLNVQSGSSQPCMSSTYNQAVHDLCLQCTIRQFRLPMFSMYNQAVPNITCSHIQSGSFRSPMFSIYSSRPYKLSRYNNQAVCSQYSSSQPPMFSMYNLAVPNLPASHSV